MIRPFIAALVCSLVLALPGAHAHADGDIRAVQASGEADGDSDAARTSAIDTALAEAVGQVLVDIVEPPVRRRWRAELNTRVVRRARRFVAGFKVLEEGPVQGRLRVRIEARVDLAKLRAELQALGVFDQAADSVGESRPKLLALVHESAADATWANFGERANRPGPAARALEKHLSERGFTLVSAAGASLPISRELPEGVPLGDDAAAGLARQKGAGGALVVGVRAWPDGAIRGTPFLGARARAVVRVLDVDRDHVSLVGRIEIDGAGHGETAEQAMAHALVRALDQAANALASTMAAYWPALVAAPEDALLIEVRGYRAWREVAALMAGLSATRGIEGVWPRQLGSRGLVLAVRTRLEARRVSAALERTAVEGVRVAVETRGAGLLVNLSAREDGP